MLAAARSFILTDDQAIAMDPASLPLGDMQPMQRARELLLDGGLYMENCASSGSLQLRVRDEL